MPVKKIVKKTNSEPEKQLPVIEEKKKATRAKKTVEKSSTSVTDKKQSQVTEEIPTSPSEVKASVADSVEKQGTRPKTITEGQVRIGLSKGVTINLGDYQSARLDCWVERIVEDNQKAMDTAYSEISASVEAYLEAEAKKLKD